MTPMKSRTQLQKLLTRFPKEYIVEGCADGEELLITTRYAKAAKIPTVASNLTVKTITGKSIYTTYK